MKVKTRRGFTIVELIVVMAIIAILTLIAVPVFTKYIDNAEDVSKDALVKATYEASIAYYVDESLEESLNLSQEDLDQFLKTDVEIVSGFDEDGNPKSNCNEFGHFKWSSYSGDNKEDIMCVHIILEGGLYQGAGITTATTDNYVVIEMYDPEAEKITSSSEPDIRYYKFKFN